MDVVQIVKLLQSVQVKKDVAVRLLSLVVVQVNTVYMLISFSRMQMG